MTARQQQLDDLLYLRLSPLRRFLCARQDAMILSADYDAAEEAHEEAKIRRVCRLIELIKARLYADGRSPLEIWAAGPDDAPFPSSL